MKKTHLFWATIITIIWGSNYSAIEIGLETIDPFVLTAFRFMLTAIPLCFFVKRPEVSMKYTCAYGLFFGVGVWGVAGLSMSLGLPAGVASLLLQFSSFFTIVLASFFLKERIRNIQYIGLVLSCFGLICIMYYTKSKYTVESVMLMILSAFSWSICNIIVKKCNPTRVVSFIIWSGLFSTPPLFIIAFCMHGEKVFLNLSHQLTGQAMFSIFFQVYVTTLFGYSVWNFLIKSYSVVKIAPISLFIPIFALITSHFMFNEEITPEKLAAIAITILGIYILMFDIRTISKWGSTALKFLGKKNDGSFNMKKDNR